MTTNAQHTSLDRFYDTLRRSPIRRSTTDRAIAGVCSGVAAHLGVSPKVTRLVTLGLVLLGVGVPAYLLAWLLLPDTAGNLHLERAVREGDTGSIVLLVVAALSILPDVHPLSGFWTLVLVAAAVIALVGFSRSSGAGSAPQAHSSAATPQDAPRG
ncbi:MAG TPA: PspC domain-containing protein [Dermatophilaceae bacterium]|nr:PspC domain-containing protein [Dermatophilaceae bacterium]